MRRSVFRGVYRILVHRQIQPRQTHIVVGVGLSLGRVCRGEGLSGAGLSGVGLSVYQNFGQREIEAT